MHSETLVAVFDTPGHAELAIQDIIAAGLPESSIRKQTGPVPATTTATEIEPVREKGFWASLFGGEPDYDTAVYNRSLAIGSTIVTVTAPEGDVSRVLEILDSHEPIDIDERASGYGLPAATSWQESPGNQSRLDGAVKPAATGGDETLRLAEERLVVGKRVVSRGGTRIRRYVVETPVEESISLRHEKVTVDRRPVTDGRAIADADFSDKTIEMVETSEEAVISKTARVVEEVSLRKETTDHVKTVRDTIRKEEAKIEQIPSQITTSSADTDALNPSAPTI